MHTWAASLWLTRCQQQKKCVVWGLSITLKPMNRSSKSKPSKGCRGGSWEIGAKGITCQAFRMNNQCIVHWKLLNWVVAPMDGWIARSDRWNATRRISGSDAAKLPDTDHLVQKAAKLPNTFSLSKASITPDTSSRKVPENVFPAQSTWIWIQTGAAFQILETEESQPSNHAWWGCESTVGLSGTSFLATCSHVLFRALVKARMLKQLQNLAQRSGLLRPLLTYPIPPSSCEAQ